MSFLVYVSFILYINCSLIRQTLQFKVIMVEFWSPEIECSIGHMIVVNLYCHFQTKLNMVSAIIFSLFLGYAPNKQIAQKGLFIL